MFRRCELAREVLDIVDGVGEWEGVTAHPHRFGGTEYRLGRRELGHVHENPGGVPVADLPFPKRVREELVAAGRARPHRILPDSGWLSVPMPDPAAAHGAVELFRMAYERGLAARERHTAE